MGRPNKARQCTTKQIMEINIRLSDFPSGRPLATARRHRLNSIVRCSSSRRRETTSKHYKREGEQDEQEPMMMMMMMMISFWERLTGGSSGPETMIIYSLNLGRASLAPVDIDLGGSPRVSNEQEEDTTD